MNRDDFYIGNEWRAYTFLGCHLERNGAVFRVYAPAAVKVSLIGEFNDWQETPMNPVEEGRFFAIYIANVKQGQMYKYKIYKKDGSSMDYCDPYGYGMELRPASASIIRDISEYTFHDKDYMLAQNKGTQQPVNIYEVHIGSWRKDYDRWYRYDEMADLLIPYLKEYKYNAVSFLSFLEHDRDEDGGFEPTCFYSPSSRYGTAADCQKMVDRFHQNGIRVLLEFPYERFSHAGYALGDFDGTDLYGTQGQFDLNKGVVVSFLQSAILYWLETYHIDGVKLVLSYDNNKNAFVKKICENLDEQIKGKIVYTEPVSKEMDKGFETISTYYNDTFWCSKVLEYFGKNVWERIHDNSLQEAALTDGEKKADEGRMLGISYKIAAGKNGTVIERMSGNYDEKFAQARVLYLYRLMCLGKKLDFMGNEIAHFREWEPRRAQDWNLLEFEKHERFSKYIKKLHELYFEKSVLWSTQKQMVVNNLSGEGSTLFEIRIKDDKNEIVTFFNLSGKVQTVCLKDNDKKVYQLLLDSDNIDFGGTSYEQEEIKDRKLKIAPLSAKCFQTEQCTLDLKETKKELEKEPAKEAKKEDKKQTLQTVQYTAIKNSKVQAGLVSDKKEPWFYRAVMYHIYPLGFCGAPEYNEGEKTAGNRILQVLDWIPHLCQMGINTVYFGPIFASGWHGYDTFDYYNTDSRLGDIEDFKQVFRALHANGIRIVLDGVFNHVGRGFAYFKDLQEKGAASAYKDWFSGVNFSGRSAGGDNFSYDTWQGNYELVKLNLYNQEVVDHLLGAVKKWIEDFDIDGLRLDAADCIDKNFFKQLKSFTKGLKKDFWLMGEIIHGDYNMWANDEMMDSVTNYECWKGIYSSHNDKNYFEIAHSLQRQFAKGGIYEGKRFYNFLDNHDVNRIASLLKDKKDLGNAYTLMFLMPGIPSVYYGSEWGIEGVKTAGREADKPVRPSIKDIQQKEINGNLAAYIGQLAQLRKNTAALCYGEYENVIIKNEQFAFARVYENQCIIAAFNISEEQAHFAFTYRGKSYDFIVEPHSNTILG